jgi:hypothetical protein
MLSLKGFLGLDGSGFELGLKRAESQAEKFSHAVKHGVGEKLSEYLGAAAIEEVARRTVEYASRIKELSERLGISTDAVQQWDYALRRSGATADAAARFFEHLAAARAKALGGDTAASAAFKKLGVSGQDLSTKRLEDLGLQIGNAVKDGDIQKLMASLREVGGRGAGELVAAFKSGLQEQFGDAPIIDAKTIIDLQAIKSEFLSLGTSLMAGMAPFLAWLGKGIRDIFDDLQGDIDTITAFVYTLFSNGSFSDAKEAARQASKEAEDSVKARNKAAEKAAEELGKGGGSGGGDETPKQQPLVKGVYDDFFKKDRKSVFNPNSLQQMGALIQSGGSPLQNELAKLTIELHAVGLTLKEYNNYAKQIGHVRAGFEGGSDGALQGRGAQF